MSIRIWKGLGAAVSVWNLSEAPKCACVGLTYCRDALNSMVVQGKEFVRPHLDLATGLRVDTV